MNLPVINLGSITSMIAIGMLTGIFSGVFGVGGGVILVPILIFFFKFPPQAASGTSLVALLLPVGFLGVLEYYKSAKITSTHIQLGLIVSVGLFFGTYFGAKIATRVSAQELQKTFSLFLVFIAIKLWFTAAV